jgi:hypothetical protein
MAYGSTSAETGLGVLRLALVDIATLSFGDLGAAGALQLLTVLVADCMGGSVRQQGESENCNKLDFHFSILSSKGKIRILSGTAVTHAMRYIASDRRSIREHLTLECQRRMETVSPGN